MIFASDLDRTLLFSKKNFTDCAASNEVVLIDVKPDGEAISFILSSVLTKLQSVSKALHFVPVTAREVHQLANVKFHEHDVFFQYAITGNGSTVLENGEIDPIWAARVENIKEKIEIARLHEVIEEKFPSVKKRERSFGFEIFEKGISLTLQEIANSFPGLRVEEDHRRSYLMYEGVDKLSALLYLKEKLKEDFIIASGDSIMDLPMIQAADVGIICATGDLLAQKQDLSFEHVTITKSEKAYASQEVLNIVERHLS